MAPKVSEQYIREVRDKILDAAEKLFSKGGYYDTSMDEIVGESGLSKGALYHYFPSKEDLFVALQDRQHEATLSELKSTFAPGDTARSKLEKTVDVAFATMIGTSKQACRINLEFDVAAPRIKPVQSRRDRRFKETHEFLAGIIREGVGKGEFRANVNPESAAMVLLATADGLSLDWATTSQNFDWKALANEVKRLVAEGLLPS